MRSGTEGGRAAEVPARLRGFLRQHFEDYQLRDDEDLFSTGFVTSMFAVQLVAFLEAEFAIQIESEDLELDNFRTVQAMQALVGRKQASTG